MYKFPKSVFSILFLLLLSQENSIWYGVDWDGPICEDEADQVQLQQVSNPLENNLDYMQLKSTILPMSYSNCNGVDLYIRVLEFIYDKLH